jgi:hypothetical protein
MTDHAQTVVDVAANITASKTVMYAGGATSFVTWLSTLEPMALAGFFLAFAGFCVTSYFAWQRNKREEKEHELKMKQLEGQCDVE